MANSLAIVGDHPTKVFWLEVMCLAQTHLIRSKVWENEITNRAIRDRAARDPPLPEDYQGYRDFIVSPRGLTRRIAETLNIHASWTSVAIRGAGGWKIQHKIAAVKGLFHQHFNRKRIGEIVAMLNLPTRENNAPQGTPEGAVAGLPIRRLWDFQGPRLLKVKIFVAWHVSVTDQERDIALVINFSYYSYYFSQDTHTTP